MISTVQVRRDICDGLVVSVSASRAVGLLFASRPVQTKDNHKNGMQIYKGKSLTLQPDFLKGPVVCRTVYGDMRFKDLLGSILQEWYRIPVPNYYLLLHRLQRSIKAL